MTHISRLRRSPGFTLIELVLVLAVGSMISLLTFQGMKRDTESNQARIVGQQMHTVGQAVDTYIANRYGAISQLRNATGGADDPGPRTCSGTSCTITIQTLVNEGLLSPIYQNLNSYGSGYTITLTVSGISPNWNVSGLVITAKPWTIGGVTRYDLLGQAMAAAGSDSGMSRVSASQIDGYGGVWNAPIISGPAFGLLGFQVGMGTSLYSVYLRRDGTLPMTGDLNLSDGTNHNIVNANNITGTGRFTSAQTYTNYVNLAGNLDMSGTATIQGNANINGNVGVGGGVSSNGAIFSEVGFWTPGASIDAVGNGDFYGSVTAKDRIYTTDSVYAAANVYGSYLVPQGSASVGSGCSTNGMIGTDGSQPLFCKSGVWAALTSGFNSIVQYDVTYGTSRALGWHALCFMSGLEGGPEGGNQQLYTTAQSGSQFNWYASNAKDGSYWSPNWYITCVD